MHFRFVPHRALSKGLTSDGMMEKYPKFRRYFSNAEGYSFTFVFFVHTLHLSTEVQGVLFGLLRTPYWAYVGSSMAALIPSMLIYTVIGDKFDFTNPLFWAFCCARCADGRFRICLCKEKPHRRRKKSFRKNDSEAFEFLR